MIRSQSQLLVGEARYRLFPAVLALCLFLSSLEVWADVAGSAAGTTVSEVLHDSGAGGGETPAPESEEGDDCPCLCPCACVNAQLVPLPPPPASLPCGPAAAPRLVLLAISADGETPSPWRPPRA